MDVEHLDFLVEEPSMEAALHLLLPKIIGNKSFRLHTFRGKHQLLKVLPQRLQGYRAWIPDSWRIIVLVDKDDDDCHELKTRMERMASKAGFLTHPASHATQGIVIYRIACEELESWYFGDWEAVRAAFPKVSSTIPNNAKYRDPDSIAGGTWEALERILQRAGYYKGGFRKIESAQLIAENMIPEKNTSHSFRVFLSALQNVCSGEK